MNGDNIRQIRFHVNGKVTCLLSTLYFSAISGYTMEMMGRCDVKYLLLYLIIIAVKVWPVHAAMPRAQVLTNARFGLTLTYPDGWVISENDGLIDLLNPTDMSQTIDGPAMAGISVKMFANQDNRSLDEIAQLLLAQTMSTEPIQLNLVPLTLSNSQISAAMTVYGLPSMTTDYVVLIAAPQRVYMWSVNLGFLIDPLRYRPKYDQILLDILNSLQLSQATWDGYTLDEPVTIAATTVTTEFGYPLGDPVTTSWGLMQAFNHFFADPRYNSYHAAEDWYQRGGTTAGEPVYAVADGVVKYAAAANYPGDVVILEHLLPDNQIYYSMYGHMGSHLVNQGQSVTRGQQLGTIYNWPGNSHLHFEIRKFFVADVINGAHSALTRHRNYPPGPGYWPVGDFKQTNERPPDRGWLEPSVFIKAHQRYRSLLTNEIYGQVKLQGQASYSNSTVILSNQPCGTISLTQTQIVITQTDSYGYFTLTPSATITYPCLQIIHTGYLSAQKVDPTRGDMGTMTLLAGDLVADDQINIFDLSLMASYYETTDAPFDLNLDGNVNILDLALLASNYGQHGPISHWE